jgi:hypothetical protein
MSVPYGVLFLQACCIGFGVVIASALNFSSVIIVCLECWLSLGYLALLQLCVTVNSRFVSHGCD